MSRPLLVTDKVRYEGDLNLPFDEYNRDSSWEFFLRFLEPFDKKYWQVSSLYKGWNRYLDPEFRMTLPAFMDRMQRLLDWGCIRRRCEFGEI